MTYARFFSIFAGLGLLFLNLGCSDFLDDVQPSGSVPVEQTFVTAEDFETAIIGAYDAFQFSTVGGFLFVTVPDLMADNAIWGSRYPAYDRIARLEALSTNAIIVSNWNTAYSGINQVNLILDKIDRSKDPSLTDDLINTIKGEAHFLRGALYFELVRYYGAPYGSDVNGDQGVPLITDGVDAFSQITFPVRASVEAIFDQAKTDLEKALELLPPSNPRGRGFGNQFSAMGYLARIAFQKRDYEKAAELAGQIISSGQYELAPTPKESFAEGGKEEVWFVINTASDGLQLTQSTNGSFDDAMISTDLIENGFDAVVPGKQLQKLDNLGYQFFDLRRTTLIDENNDLTKKYSEAPDGNADAPNMRLAEFYLMWAESMARLNGKQQEYIDVLNSIRTRALRVEDANGQPPANWEQYISYSEDDFSFPQELWEAIILERRVELAFEGNRLHDLKRLQRDVYREDKMASFSFDDCILRFPVPQTEIDANPNLIQNECN